MSFVLAHVQLVPEVVNPSKGQFGRCACIVYASLENTEFSTVLAGKSRWPDAKLKVPCLGVNPEFVDCLKSTWDVGAHFAVCNFSYFFVF